MRKAIAWVATAHGRGDRLFISSGGRLMSRLTVLSFPPNSSVIPGLTASMLFAGDSNCRQTTFTGTAIDGSGLTATVTSCHGG